MARRLVAVSSVLVAIAAGCGGGGGGAATPGSEGARCDSNGACHDGLTCASDFCIPAHPSGGAGGPAATGGAGGSARGGSIGTATPDAGFDAAAHAPLPQVANLGGPVLATPKLLPIVYASDPDGAAIQAFLGRLQSGSYWSAATSEYGVGALTVLPGITITSAAPSSIDDADLQAIIAGNVGASGTLGVADPSTIYLFVIPQGTVATMQQAACCSDFGGYHDETTAGGVAVSYAVACACPDFFGPGWRELDERTAAMSHEIVESATDPFPMNHPAMRTADAADQVWTLVTGAEVGDMCEVQQDAFIRAPGSNDVVQRIWSNAAAELGQNPCVPAPTAVPYFNSLPVLNPVPFGSQGAVTNGVQIPIGQSQTVDLDLFSDGPIAQAWTVSVVSYEAFTGKGSPSLQLSLDKNSGRNGDVLHLTITAVSTNAQFGADPFLVVSTHGAPGDADFQSNVAMGLVTN